MKAIKLFLIPLWLFSIELKDTTINYKVSYGFFGELARSKLTLRVDNDRYRIDAEAYPVGVASSMLKERKDTFSSRGYIENSTLKPTIFKNFSKSNERISKKVYKFDHKKESVHYNREKSKKKYNWKLKTTSKENPFYSKNDIFTLFFNIMDQIPKLPTDKKNRFVVVGANSKTGALDIVLPTGKSEKSIRKLLGAKKEELVLKIFINRKILSSSSGELYVALDKDGYCSSAILKDVLLFGDLKIDRVK